MVKLSYQINMNNLKNYGFHVLIGVILSSIYSLLFGGFGWFMAGWFYGDLIIFLYNLYNLEFFNECDDRYFLSYDYGNSLIVWVLSLDMGINGTPQDKLVYLIKNNDTDYRNKTVGLHFLWWNIFYIEHTY